ncbi:MAG TPA: hypothetical protein VG328_01230 [Stellaceae bacterium]|jgi:hypothetical protein|nr:hypothetical protein [Stellaceae bacterium]
MSEAEPPRIDVHHHPVLASHLSYMGRNSANPAAIRNWTLKKSLDDMERARRRFGPKTPPRLQRSRARPTTSWHN